MAQGKTVTTKKIVNNKPAVQVNAVVELNVVGGILVPEHTQTNHGVNTKDLKN